MLKEAALPCMSHNGNLQVIKACRTLLEASITCRQGHIVTNFHVIRGASNIKVALIDSSVFPARVRPALCCLRIFSGAQHLHQSRNPVNPTPLHGCGAVGQNCLKNLSSGLVHVTNGSHRSTEQSQSWRSRQAAVAPDLNKSAWVIWVPCMRPGCV